MKIFRNIFLILPVLALAVLVSCVGEPEKPAAPDTDLKANITIAELINRFGSISYTNLDSAWFIEGVVVGNDIGGNIYKKIYLQDETAGIDIEIEMTNNHHKYAIGQRLVISLKGLAIGLYGGQPQIAGQGNDVVQRLYEPECDEHFFRKGYASAANLPQPKLLTIDDINFRPNRYVGMLIRIDSVRFQDVGLTFATAGDAGNGSNRNILDQDNNELVCRNSTYALFANDIIPGDTGSIVGILGIYNGTPQFYFRDKNDIIDFVTFPIPTNLYAEYDSIDRKTTLHWTRGYNTDSIRVQIENPAIGFDTIMRTTQDKIELYFLQPNTDYRWRVQSIYKDIYSSEWSEKQVLNINTLLQ